MYVLNADTGALLGNASGATCATVPSTGTGCLSVGDVTTNSRKNALQADPTAAGDYGSPTVKKSYIGDIDGKYWRFNFDNTGALTATLMVDSGQPIYASSALLFIGSVDVYMFFATGSDSLPASTSGGTGKFKLMGLKDSGSSAMTKFSLDLAQVSYDATSKLTTGERASTAPTVAGDIVFYTSTVEDALTPCVDFSANLYAVTYTGTAAYDAASSGDGRVTTGESPKVKTMVGRATAPFVVDQHLFVATSAGSGGAGSGNGGGSGDRTGAKIEAFGDPDDFNNGVGQVGVRILSWREIR
jgi:hypothetical protein